MQYIQDFDERLPNNDNNGSGAVRLNALEMLMPYIKSPQIYVCPSSANTDRHHFWEDTARPVYTYAFNNIYGSNSVDGIFESPSKSLAAFAETSNTIFCGDSQPGLIDPVDAHQVTGSSLAYRDTTPPTFGSTNASDMSNQGQYCFRHQRGANFVFLTGT